MNVSLTAELEQFVNEKVASGVYHSASEVIVPVAGRDEDKNQELAGRKILLVAQVLIDRDEDLEVTLHEPEQFSILFGRPAHLVGGLYFVLGE